MFWKELLEDAKNIAKKDPACRGVLTAILLYPGFHILLFHRIAHFLYIHRLFLGARIISRNAEDFLLE